MGRKAIVFFPHTPYPPRWGAHKRCLEMLSGLREVGYEVTLTIIGSNRFRRAKQERSSIQYLKANYVADVQVYKMSIPDRGITASLKKFYNLLKRQPPLNSALYTPPGARRWFGQVFHKILPNLVLINYATWNNLLDYCTFDNTLRIIDMHDLITLNQKMCQILNRYKPNGPLFNADKTDSRVFVEDFFDKFDLSVSPEEFNIYDRYEYTIAINSKEAHIVKKNTQKTKVLLIPMTHQPCYITNRYTGPAYFLMGPNSFNIQGYLYFIVKVLPKIQKKIPSFILHVTGHHYFNKGFSPINGVFMKGFTPDLKTIYETAKFVVCPIFGGTGQKVKIVEAMAYGVPVIALRAAAEGSPLIHSVNGLVAENADEFADYAIWLWKDTKLCHQLGHAARETIATKFSRSRLLEELSFLNNKQ